MTHKELLLEPALKKWYQYKAEKKDIIFEKIDNAQINNLLNIFYRSGEVIVDTIRKELNMAATLVNINIDQLEYNKLFAKNVIEYHAEVANDYSWLLPRELISLLLSRSLGFINQDLLTKELTNLETEMIKSILEIITKSSYVFWLGSLDVAGDFIINVDLKENKKIHKDELVIQISMIIELGEYGKFPIIFFATSSNVKKFLEKYDQLSQEKRQQTVDLQGNSVSDIDVPVEVILGNTDVPMNDILSMQIGDVFQLDQRVGSPVIVKMGPQAEFISFFGKKGNELVVRVEDLKGSQTAEELINQIPTKTSVQEIPAREEPRQEFDDHLFKDSSLQVQDSLQETITEEKNDLLVADFNDNEDHGDEIIEKIENSDSETLADDDFNWDIDDL